MAALCRSAERRALKREIASPRRAQGKRPRRPSTCRDAHRVRSTKKKKKRRKSRRLAGRATARRATQGSRKGSLARARSGALGGAHCAPGGRTAVVRTSPESFNGRSRVCFRALSIAQSSRRCKRDAQIALASLFVGRIVVVFVVVAWASMCAAATSRRKLCMPVAKRGVQTKSKTGAMRATAGGTIVV